MAAEQCVAARHEPKKQKTNQYGMLFRNCRKINNLNMSVERQSGREETVAHLSGLSLKDFSRAGQSSPSILFHSSEFHSPRYETLCPTNGLSFQVRVLLFVNHVCTCVHFLPGTLSAFSITKLIENGGCYFPAPLKDYLMGG